MDRCVDELSSTLELAQALEDQLEQVRRTAEDQSERRDTPDLAA